jgi:ATP-dependent Lon protease
MTFISFFEALETKTNDEIIKMLNENSQFINLRKEDGDTPLHIAARHGNVKLVSEFLKRGAELSALNNNNETPLNIAITNGWNRCVDVINQHIKNTMNQTFRLLSRRANNNRLQTPSFMLENNNDFKPTEPSFSLKDKISSSNIPDDYKKYAIDKEKGLLLNFGPSASKDKEWIETLLKVPFNNYSNLPVNKDSSIESIKEYFKEVNEKLEEASYGMENVKEEVIDYISQMISTNGEGMPRVICIQGIQGSGKTNIVRNGISKVLNRPFQQINMGGISDADYLLGHDSTYVGSKPGRIIQALINSKVMNPIIFMDEVDKISSTEKGNDIQSVLIHLTDPVQNKDFQDKYFIGLNIDVSKAIFIFSCNDESKLSPILRDRLNIIKIKEPSVQDKIVIGKKYLLKELVPNIGLSFENIKLEDEVVKHIINQYCKDDSGVRGLKKCIESILMKINSARYSVSKYKSLKNINVDESITITIKMVDDIIIKREDTRSEMMNSMFI